MNIEEADLGTSVAIAYKDLLRALAELESKDPDLGHVYMWVNSASIWLREWAS